MVPWGHLFAASERQDQEGTSYLHWSQPLVTHTPLPLSQESKPASGYSTRKWQMGWVTREKARKHEQSQACRKMITPNMIYLSSRSCSFPPLNHLKATQYIVLSCLCSEYWLHLSGHSTTHDVQRRLHLPSSRYLLLSSNSPVYSRVKELTLNLMPQPHKPITSCKYSKLEMIYVIYHPSWV